MHPIRIGALAAAAALATAALAQTAPAPAKPAAKPPAKAAAKKAPARKAPPPPAPLPDADEEQRKAADLTHYGDYACEFAQSVHVARHARHHGYVDVRFGKLSYTMKPVLSSTGALRLEDVEGRTLMIQIPMKSMLMDVKVGRRLVDECVHERQLTARQAAASQPADSGIGIDPDKARAAMAAEAAAVAASAAATAATAAASAADMAASAAAEAASAVAPVPAASPPAASAPTPSPAPAAR